MVQNGELGVKKIKIYCYAIHKLLINIIIDIFLMLKRNHFSILFQENVFHMRRMKAIICLQCKTCLLLSMFALSAIIKLMSSAI